MKSSRAERADSYFLSAASNLGAACALIAYPFIIEPLLWTAPLAAYLLTFVLNFKRKPKHPERLNRAMLPMFAFWLALRLIPIALAFRFSADSVGRQLQQGHSHQYLSLSSTTNGLDFE